MELFLWKQLKVPNYEMDEPPNGYFYVLNKLIYLKKNDYFPCIKAFEYSFCSCDDNNQQFDTLSLISNIYKYVLKVGNS